jgi:hypothetical protein
MGSLSRWKKVAVRSENARDHALITYPLLITGHGLWIRYPATNDLWMNPGMPNSKPPRFSACSHRSLGDLRGLRPGVRLSTEDDGVRIVVGT